MNRVVLITGASRGLGLSLARRFVETGDTVVGVSKTKRAWKSAEKHIADSKHFFLFAADLTKEPAVKRLVSSVRKKFGEIDLVINNSGYGGMLAEVKDLPFSEFQKSVSNNLTAAFLVSKHVLPGMKKKKAGWMINVSSMAGKRAVPRLFAYSASKFGVLALSQCIAKENDKDGIRCITVCPGGMNTEMRAGLFGQEDASKQQSPDFVADVVMQIIDGKINVESGGDIVIRHGKITAINPCPGI